MFSVPLLNILLCWNCCLSVSSCLHPFVVFFGKVIACQPRLSRHVSVSLALPSVPPSPVVKVRVAESALSRFVQTRGTQQVLYDPLRQARLSEPMIFRKDARKEDI